MPEYINSTTSTDADNLYRHEFIKNDFFLFRNSAKQGKLSEVKTYLDYGIRNQLLLDMLMAINFDAFRKARENNHQEVVELLIARAAKYPNLCDSFITNSREPGAQPAPPHQP